MPYILYYYLSYLTYIYTINISSIKCIAIIVIDYSLGA